MPGKRTTKAPTYDLVLQLLHCALHDIEEALRMTHFIGVTEHRHYDGILTGYLRVAGCATSRAHDDLKDWIERNRPNP